MNILKQGFLLLAILSAGFSNAQTMHSDVLIAGGTESGMAAAIQAAHSGVKALLIVEGSDLVSNISEVTDTTFSAGIAANFAKMVNAARKDSVTGVLSPFSQALASSVLTGWTDTIKNLTVMRNASWTKVERSGKGWEIKLKDGKTLKVNVIIDATPNGTVASKASIPFDQATGYYKTEIGLAQLDIKQPYNNRLYRTSIAVANSDDIPFSLPLGTLVASGAENFILAGRLPVLKGAKKLEPATMASGQAAGATAAYCSFFKTTTKTLNARVIQGELFAYKSWLMPFADVLKSDSNAVAIQRVGITGLLKGSVVNGKLLFNPDSTISAADLKVPMREFYTRSQIWFADNKIDKFTLGNTLSLIKFVANRGEELSKEVEKGWKSSFKFNGAYDLNHIINRREFAVLADAYLKPFNVRVDTNGFLVN